MSSRILKYEINYDNNCGDFETEIIYRYFNNSSDFQVFADKFGIVDLAYKTDSYIKVLGHLIVSEETEDEFEYWKLVGEVSWCDLPENIRNFFAIY